MVIQLNQSLDIHRDLFRFLLQCQLCLSAKQQAE